MGSGHHAGVTSVAGQDPYRLKPGGSKMPRPASNVACNSDEALGLTAAQRGYVDSTNKGSATQSGGPGQRGQRA